MVLIKNIKLNLLETETQAKAELLLKKARAIFTDYEIVVGETYRSIKRQNALYKKGNNVTTVKGGYSWHNHGRAIDIYFAKGWKKLQYKEAPYLELGKLGESLGFVWGGRWHIPFDPVHFEYHPRHAKISDFIEEKKLFKLYVGRA